MDKEIKIILLKLLEEDEEVISAVKRVIDTQTENNEVVGNLKEKLLQQIRQLETEKRLKESELSQIKRMHEDELEGYSDFRRKYADIDTVYNKYVQLGDAVFKRMERILNHSDEVSERPEIFMAYGMQENNIVALWESIASNLDFYDSNGKTQDLIDIFQYFLALYKEITYKNVVIYRPNLGDSYDERIHTRTSSSSAVGKIQKVILPGFSIGKNISKKSLVIVK